MRLLVSQKGIALLMTLWLMVILTIMVLSFSLMTKTEAHSTLSYKDGTENKFLARAGMERAITEILYRNVYKNQNITMQGFEVFHTDGTPYTGKIGDGNYKVAITDESGKLDINALSDASGVILNNLLVNMGVQKETADTIVDSILDWKDADDLHRLHGAENDYYMSLPHPYKAKNTGFDTLEELFLVKGVPSDILYGNDQQKGLINFITVYSRSGKININVASREILMAIPGMTADMAENIIFGRQNKASGNIQDAQANLGAGYSAISPYIGTGESNIFTIDVVGYKDNEKKGYAIRATVIIEGNNKYRFAYYKSPAYIR